MTRAILNEIAKSKKVNLSIYDHVDAYINENYTKIIVTFFQLEVSPMGGWKWCNTKRVTLSVNNILRKEERFPDEYETDGSKWLWEIR